MAIPSLLHGSLALTADPTKETKSVADTKNAAFEEHDANIIRSLMMPYQSYAGQQRTKSYNQTLPAPKDHRYSARFTRPPLQASDSE